ncbi:MAG: esterase [Pirellula sp.]|nr:esterase [Pirellula sp.]
MMRRLPHLRVVRFFLPTCLLLFAVVAPLAADEPSTAPKTKPAAAAKKQPIWKASVKPTQADVAYGPQSRNVLDFYQAKSDTPTPLILYIHGGGFHAGDKSSFNARMLEPALKAGISCAGINYRFVNGKDVLFPTPQRDSARALQFLRSKAKEWNIDTRRIACFGGSAGAGITMWLGFHDDLADPQASDPVLRESTRLTALGTFGGQGTYSPIAIKELIGGRTWEHASILKAFGIATAEEALQPTAEQRKLYDEVSAITHLTRDDPPLYMVYSEADGPIPADAPPGKGIHHPNFGRQLKKKMDELGIENVYVYTEHKQRLDESSRMLEFFQKHFAAVK